MAGKAEAVEGVVRITGAGEEQVYGQAQGAPAPEEPAEKRRRRQLKALVMYRQLLGIAGRPRVREDGRVVKRGVSEKVQARLQSASGVPRAQLLQRVKHFTRCVVIGSGGFVDYWLELHRSWLVGSQRRAS